MTALLRLLSVLLLLAPVVWAKGDRFAADLAAIEAYLDGLRRFQARFLQIGPEGEESLGTLYVKRPGRLRIDYDPPSKVRLIATDWRLIFYDGSIKQVNTIPLSQTPLAFLLEEQIRFAEEIEVAAVERWSGELWVTVMRREVPEAGRVTLRFRESPLNLSGWLVQDPQGRLTEVRILSLETDLRLPDELFRWRDPRIFGLPDD